VIETLTVHFKFFVTFMPQLLIAKLTIKIYEGEEI